jgi:superfamily II DNA helicase RecQ
MSLDLHGILYRPVWDCFLCGQCRYGVRPGEVHAHWGKRHGIKGRELRTIIDICGSHRTEHLESCAHIASELDTADPILLYYNDGLQCQKVGQACSYICRDERKMRQHCRTAHGWSEFGRRGRPSGLVRSIASLATQGDRPWIRVSCQRIFPSGPDSHFIRVRDIDCAGSNSNSNDIPHPMLPLGLYERHQSIMQQQRDHVDKSSYEYDGDRWLKRTGWRNFLTGSVRTKVLEYVVEPRQGSPPYESMIWDAVAHLIGRAEELLLRSSHFVRVAIVQVEDSHHIQQPLQPYQGRRQLQKGVRAWQQIVLFFVRHNLGGLGLDIRLSDTQKETLAALVAVAKSTPYEDESHQSEDMPPMQELERGILFFIISLLDYVVQGWEYESPLVCALAVIAVRPQGWLGLDKFPSILSALIKTSRYLVLQEAYETPTVLAEADVTRAAGPRLEDVERLTHRFLRRGTRSPFEWMFDLRSYGQHLAMQSAAGGKVSWTGDRLSYGDISLDISQLKRMVSLLSYDTRQLLDSCLLFGLPTPAISIQSLVDNPSSTEAGFSLVRHSEARKLLEVEGGCWLLDQVVRSPDLQLKFFADRTSNTFKLPAVNQYMHSVNHFRTNLAVLCHITSGQPARATELLSIRHRNSYEGEQRGVYLDGGLVNLTTSYYKGSTIEAKADVNIIQRYLPESVGLVVVRYLWLVLPWIELLETQCYSRTKVSDHLWPDQLPGHAFDENSFRTRFRQITEKYTGCSGINISSYRHVAIAISRKYLTAVEQFVDVVDASDEQGDAVDGTTPLDAQASHSSYVAQLVYGRDGQAVAGSLPTSRDKFRTVSRAWHSLLGCGSLRREEDVSKSDKAVTEQQVVRRWELLRQSDPLVQLRELFSPQAEFRPKQDEVLRAVYDGVSPILAIMPTGSGKSLSFILPASYEFSGTTIVVTPLLALQQDMLRRTTKLSIPARVWTKGSDDTNTKIVFVTPESARTEDFLSYFHRLRTTGQIDRIVFDECHIFSDDDITFRPAIKELVSLFQFNVRLVFLTATLPVSQELPFWQLLGLQRVLARTVRADTTRRNLAYTVSYVPLHDRLAEMERYIQLAAKAKIIIYCRRKQTATTLAAQLGCPYYFSSYEDKKASLEDFVAAEQGVIVTTNALGLGIDIPNVRAVIHYDCPDSLIAYAQESGRAGRDGKESRCILFVGEPSATRTASYKQRKRSFAAIASHSLDVWLQRYISTPDSAVCRRTTLSEYLDGVVRDKGCQDSAGCDVCTAGAAWPRTSAAVQEMQSPIDRHIFRSQERSQDFVRHEFQASQAADSNQRQRIVRFLASISATCFQCMAYGSDASHLPSECPEPRDTSYEEAVQAIRKTISFDRYSGCFSCGMPQELCQTFVRTANGMTKSRDQRDCTYRKGLFEAAGVLIAELYRTRHRRSRLYEELGLVQGQAQRGTQQGTDIIQKLGKRTRWLGWETNVLFRTTTSWYLDILFK